MVDKGTILIVDDEAIVRDSLSAWPEDEGFSVYTAENGEAALQLLGNRDVEVAVFDLKMPGMDGVTLLKRTLESGATFVVVMMTALWLV